MFILQSIKTPSDFARTIDANVTFNHTWITSTPEAEPHIRDTVDAIFCDLDDIDSGERGMVSSYLSSIADPLNELRAMGLQLVAIVESGKLTMPTGTLDREDEVSVPVEAAHYIVATDPAFYRLVDRETLVHKLGVNCDGIRQFTRSKGEHLAVYSSRDSLELAYEHNVPWCAVCQLEALSDDLG